MGILADNIRYLRAQLKLSQQKIADSLIITRGRYAKYEDGATEPPIEILVRISRLYHVSIDLLVSVDLKKYPLKEILTLPDNRIVLPVKTDLAGNNKIEIIPHRAQMGYLSGYSDPEYIDSLDYISLPFLGSGKYRAFPAAGDSMLPLQDGSYIIGEYLEDATSLKKDKTYIFVTRNDGIVYKRFTSYDEEGILVKSDNELYPPYQIFYQDLVEIWKFSCSINIAEFDGKSYTNQDELKSVLKTMQTDIKEIKNICKTK